MFTYKTIKGTKGDYPRTVIKYNKKEVGYIQRQKHLQKHIVMLTILRDAEEYNQNKDKDSCIWKWTQLNQKFDSLEEAKSFLDENKTGLEKTYTFYSYKA